MNNIWIINQHIGTPSMGVDGHRHYYLAKTLYNRDYNVTLLTSTFSHVPRKNIKQSKNFEVKEEEGITLGLVKTPRYASARGFGRIWSMIIFMIKLFCFPFSILDCPDVVIVSSPSLLSILNGLLLKRKYGCKLVLEIRDIWPLSITELGGFSKYNPLVVFLRCVELIGYKKYDHITSLLPLTKEHIESSLKRSKSNFTHIPNGIYLDEKEAPVKLNNCTESNIPKEKFIIGYAGSLGVANAMNPVIDAANMCGEDIALCIVGEGYEKSSLEKISTNKNTIFLDSVSKREVVDLLDHFDVLILSWHDISLYRFGVSANKIFDYMYSGKPIIMAGNIGENVIELANCGIVVKPNDHQAIFEAIVKLRDMDSEERKRLGDNGREYVMRNNDFNILTTRYEEIFNFLYS